MSQVEAWRELNRRVAADLERGEGDIKPAKVKAAKADAGKLSLLSINQTMKLLASTLADRR